MKLVYQNIIYNPYPLFHYLSYGIDLCATIYKWIKEVIYVHTVEYSVSKKKLIPPFVTTLMNLDGIPASEISHTQKDKLLLPHILIYVEPKTAKLLKGDNRILAVNCWECGSWRSPTQIQKILILVRGLNSKICCY